MSSISDWFHKQTHPIYNNLGRYVGWYRTDQDLAAGHAFALPGEILGPPPTWRVKYFGIVKNADDYLINDAGIQPSWLQPGGVITESVQVADKPPISVPEIKMPEMIMPSLNLDFSGLGDSLSQPIGAATGKVVTTTWLILGGAALLAGVFVARKI